MYCAIRKHRPIAADVLVFGSRPLDPEVERALRIVRAALAALRAV